MKKHTSTETQINKNKNTSQIPYYYYLLEMKEHTTKIPSTLVLMPSFI